MDTAALIYREELARYRFAPGHPFTPARHVLAVQLMREWGLLESVRVIEPEPATVDDVLLVHTPELLAAVVAASKNPAYADPRFGIGPGDTPAFAGMHEAALLVAGSTIAVLDTVLGGTARRAFGPAGGLHHAHRDRSAGFCIYNDCAIAIERAIRAAPGLKIAYIDIDVHHGDGVQEAFFDRADVLTVSVHESGAYLYPGTGHAHEMGTGDGHGFALNVPLLPGSGAECYQLVLAEAIGPALRAFAPDAIVLQGGADTHRDDPLASLDNTVRGYVDLVAGITTLADELCGGRLAMVGGGGYESYSAVPRMWAASMAVLAGLPVPGALPAAWIEASHNAAAVAMSAAPPAATDTFAEGSTPVRARKREAALDAVKDTVAKLHRAHPLFAKVS